MVLMHPFLKGQGVQVFMSEYQSTTNFVKLAGNVHFDEL